MVQDWYFQNKVCKASKKKAGEGGGGGVKVSRLFSIIHTRVFVYWASTEDKAIS